MNNKINWKKYTLEFLSIFIAVISAFTLSNWNENRNSRDSQEKTLLEIKNGLGRDIQDFSGNINSHKRSIKANSFFRDLIQNKQVPEDSISLYYILLFRDYPPIINRSGYESLKSNGLKTISNDSLRFQIIALYDYYYRIIEILEEDVMEMQSYQNYFEPVNTLLSPYMEFDDAGKLLSFSNLDQLTKLERKEIMSYLWRLETNRKYKLKRYDLIVENIRKVEQNIKVELEK